MNKFIQIALLPFALTFASRSLAVSPRKQLGTNNVANEKIEPFDQSYANYAEILQRAVVAQGSVSKVYYRWLMHHQNKLLVYLKSVSAVTRPIYLSWTKQQQEAFLINAYNGFTIELIVDHYPVNSIKEIGGLFKNPWKIDFISLFQKKTSLDDIEHTLRTKFDDPRIHFAINCASIGCPPILNKPYLANSLDDQLNNQARLFLRDGVKNKINVATKTLKLSKIFDWYASDFAKKAGSVQKFIAPYITDNQNVRKELIKDEFSISYTEYNWNLNGAFVPKRKSHFWSF